MQRPCPRCRQHIDPASLLCNPRLSAPSRGQREGQPRHGARAEAAENDLPRVSFPWPRHEADPADLGTMQRAIPTKRQIIRMSQVPIGTEPGKGHDPGPSGSDARRPAGPIMAPQSRLDAGPRADKGVQRCLRDGVRIGIDGKTPDPPSVGITARHGRCRTGGRARRASACQGAALTAPPDPARSGGSPATRPTTAVTSARERCHHDAPCRPVPTCGNSRPSKPDCAGAIARIGALRQDDPAAMAIGSPATGPQACSERLDGARHPRQGSLGIGPSGSGWFPTGT